VHLAKSAVEPAAPPGQNCHQQPMGKCQSMSVQVVNVASE
jgi:hypothetical protein